MKARGFSLVELLVALAVGMVVVAALATTFYTAATTGRHGQGMAQMTEDANTALTILRASLAQVGYSRPVSVTSGTTPTFNRAYATTNPGLFGCDGKGAKFSDTSTTTIGALDCATVSGTADSLAVAYEADSSNSVVSSAGVPYDCLGNALALQGAGASAYYLAFNRFYINSNSLMCKGPASTAGAQALVDNVVDMQITYLRLFRASGNPDKFYYATAGSGAGTMTAAEFAAVAAVRVCVVVQSADEIMDEKTNYWGCDTSTATKVTASDKRMHRAYTTTVVLQNRM
jgi:type IV pilus assembly protein PilW